jgi:hypothetical protein
LGGVQKGRFQVGCSRERTFPCARCAVTRSADAHPFRTISCRVVSSRDAQQGLVPRMFHAAHSRGVAPN